MSLEQWLWACLWVWIILRFAWTILAGASEQPTRPSRRVPLRDTVDEVPPEGAPRRNPRQIALETETHFGPAGENRRFPRPSVP